MNSSDILTRLNNPRALEELYQENKAAFKATFNRLYPQLTDDKLAAYWYERLNYERSEISWGSKSELVIVIIISLLAGLIAKLPALLHIDPELFYQRNIGLIVFPALTAYFAWKDHLAIKKIVLAAIAFL